MDLGEGIMIRIGLDILDLRVFVLFENVFIDFS